MSAMEILNKVLWGLAIIGLAFIFISLIHVVGPATDRVEDKWRDTGKRKFMVCYCFIFIISVLLMLLCICVLPGTVVVGLVEEYERRKACEYAIRDYIKKRPKDKKG